jgi:cation:H+ antiporter
MGKDLAKEGAKASGKGYLGTVIFAVVFFFAGLGCFLYNNSTEVTKLLVAIVLFVFGLAFLIKGGDWFVDGATAIAEKFKVPEILIGATVVSIGTTLPEVMVSAQAAAKGNSGISYGNAIGSIICNVSLIAAITLAVRPAKVEKKTLRIPVIFFFIAAVFYAVNAYVFGQFSRVTGVILLLTFLVYMVINVKQALSEVKAQKAGASGGADVKAASGDAEDRKATDAEADEEEKKEMPIWVSLILLVLGAAVIAFGATLLVDNGTIIAQKMGVPDSVIALTFVALGTSLPELVTAISSLAKGHGALSLGNIIGANIFNLVLVSGLAVTIRPFAVPSEKLIAGMNASLLVDIPMVFLVMLLLTVPPLIKGKLYRFQGIALLLIYAAYMAFQFLA